MDQRSAVKAIAIAPQAVAGPHRIAGDISMAQLDQKCRFAGTKGAKINY